MRASALRYPLDWAEIAAKAKNFAGWKCEACGAAHGSSPTMLTTHHLDRDKMNPHRVPRRWPHRNLIALCQRCHLRAEHWAIAGEILSREEAITRLQLRIREERAQRSLSF